MYNKLSLISLSPACCAVDLNVGSERGEYVSQDYILDKLNRPHRAISIMYCYYPNDIGWPIRASIVHKKNDIDFAWDYPYDDYHVYKDSIDSIPHAFEAMREIRSHGQDIILTLTIDPLINDIHLIKIAEELRPFGKMFLRINHEATGNWFSFNKRCTYQQVADFFTRFNKIIKKHAPNVYTIICIGGVENVNVKTMVKEKEFTKTIIEADIWSVDKYLSLNWGWPYYTAEENGDSFFFHDVNQVYMLTKKSYERFKFLNNNESKPIFMSEFNADGDVTGPYNQIEYVKDFYNLIKADTQKWFSGICFYQFRDRGRLGLENENPNNPSVGIEQPILKAYKSIINDDFFKPKINIIKDINLPVKLRWSSSEDAEGISIDIFLEKNPVFIEVYFEDNNNYIFEINNKWFYKSPCVQVIDLMPAFFDLKETFINKTFKFNLFAPPKNGENDLSIEDGLFNSYTLVEVMPKFRIRYKPTKE